MCDIMNDQNLNETKVASIIKMKTQHFFLKIVKIY